MSSPYPTSERQIQVTSLFTISTKILRERGFIEAIPKTNISFYPYLMYH
jgi:hypothetical protein